MKYVFCFLWSLLIAFPCIAQTSNAEAKAQINKIKKVLHTYMEKQRWHPRKMP